MSASPSTTAPRMTAAAGSQVETMAVRLGPIRPMPARTHVTASPASVPIPRQLAQPARVMSGLGPPSNASAPPKQAAVIGRL